ncbi:MAG: transketolase C-terminal domain-containing protein [Planctomycetaceae bacterium]|nr:transketolase family protein [Planctomycetaceae bacterium]
MRKALLDILTQLMHADRSIYILTADTGFHVFDEFPQRFPNRFINVGISEAAMIGMAAGLAMAGKQVFTYGIVPFVTMRCFEQIRVDLCYPNLPVKVIGVGGGLTYGPAGMTHHSIEDIALMSCLPNMSVVCPGDPVETGLAIEASMVLKGPCYLRLGKSGEPAVHPRRPEGFAIGKGIALRRGRDVALVATGNMLATAAAACDLLERRGLSCELISMHTVKPIDADLIAEAASRCPVIATLEEHSIIGGLGSMVAGVAADRGLKVALRRFALPDRYEHKAGSQEYLRGQYGLTAEAVAADLLKIAAAAD